MISDAEIKNLLSLSKLSIDDSELKNLSQDIESMIKFLELLNIDFKHDDILAENNIAPKVVYDCSKSLSNEESTCNSAETKDGYFYIHGREKK